MSIVNSKISAPECTRISTPKYGMHQGYNIEFNIYKEQVIKHSTTAQYNSSAYIFITMCIFHLDRRLMTHNLVFFKKVPYHKFPYQYQWYVKINWFLNVTSWYKIVWWCLYTNNNNYLDSILLRLAILLPKENYIQISLHIYYTTYIFINKDVTCLPFTIFPLFQLLEIFPTYFNHLHQNTNIILSHFFAPPYLLLICYKPLVIIFVVSSSTR